MVTGLMGCGRMDQRSFNGVAYGPVFALIDRRHRIHHHKKGEQQRDEVRVGHQPTFVIFMFFVFFLGHQAS